MECFGADASTYVAVAADLKITSAIQNTEMNEDAALGLSIVVFFAVFGLIVLWVACTRKNEEDYESLTDTV